MDIRIYIAAHVPFAPVTRDAAYIPLHVGCKGKAEIGYVGDHTGDHISEKNPSFCELTGLYWIWKNIQADVVGLCHYRRYLSREGRVLTGEDICRILKSYDLILPDSARMPGYQTEYEHYIDKHEVKDLECCLEVIREKYPEYETAFLWTLSSNLMTAGNIMVAPKPLFDSYCSWLFDILFEVERRTDVSGYDAY